jgi:hypothetical protein
MTDPSLGIPLNSGADEEELRFLQYPRDVVEPVPGITGIELCIVEVEAIIQSARP